MTDTKKPDPKRLFIKTYGCQMNVYDSERMTDILRPLGYVAQDMPEDADLVVLNTCHIREKAAEKVYSELGRIRKLKEQRQSRGQDMRVAVAGCVAQAEGAEIMRRAPVVDMVLGPQTYHKLPEMIARIARDTGEQLETDFDVEDKFDALAKPRQIEGYSAFVTVQEGCDKFCTFCVVPYTRGAEWSRPIDQITAEIRGLVASGIREVTLLGQNVNAYHGDAPAGTGGGTWGLGQLVLHLAKIEGLDRIRYTTSHPNDMTDDLYEAHRSEPKLMPYLHLPVQSGSNRILSAMNRRHTFEDYRRVIDRMRDMRPDLALSGDFIVGFPGESDLDFKATLKAVEEIGYASAFSFKYSRRPGTPGAALPGQIPEDVKAARLAELQDLLRRQQMDFNTSLIGKTLPVLIERKGRKAGQVHGRSPYLQAVHLDAPEDNIGQIIDVTIESVTQNALAGRLKAKAGAAA